MLFSNKLWPAEQFFLNVVLRFDFETTVFGTFQALPIHPYHNNIPYHLVTETFVPSSKISFTTS
jgi:hypothetical protein